MSRTSAPALCPRIVSQSARAAGASRKRGNFNANVSAMLRPNGGESRSLINSRDFFFSFARAFFPFFLLFNDERPQANAVRINYYEVDDEQKFYSIFFKI